MRCNCMLESSRIEINGVTIYFNIKRKKIKNMYMKFSEDGVLHITVPNNIEINKLDNESKKAVRGNCWNERINKF